MALQVAALDSEGVRQASMGELRSLLKLVQAGNGRTSFVPAVAPTGASGASESCEAPQAGRHHAHRHQTETGAPWAATRRATTRQGGKRPARAGGPPGRPASGLSAPTGCWGP
jgi:hypothetical protein